MLHLFRRVRFTLTVYSCIVLLAATLAVMAVCAIGWTVWYYNEHRHVDTLAREYHQATIIQLEVLATELERLKSDFQGLPRGTPHDGTDQPEHWHTDHRQGFEHKIYVINKHLGNIHRLQERYRNRVFDNLLAKLTKQSTYFDTMPEVLHALSHDEPSLVSKRVDGVAITIEQLRRLHATIYNELRGDLTAAIQKKASGVIAVIAMVLLLGCGLIFQLIRLIRGMIHDMQESRDRYVWAEQIGRCGHWDWDIATGDLYWSDEIYRIFGLTPQSFGATYQAFLESVHPDDRSFVQERVNVAVNNGEEYSLDHRIVLPSGEVRLVHEQGEVTRDTEGKPIRMMGTVVDITERKQAEEHKAYMGQIFETSLNEIFIFDAETLRFTEVNRGARENLGYSMDELKHLTPLDLKPEYTPELFEQLTEPLRNNCEEKVVFTTTHRRKDGSLYPVEVYLQLSRIKSPAVFVAIIIDITERQQAQQALQEAHDKLEERVQQRTQELEETNKELEAFTYSVSHDLRAPVRHIDSFSKILMKECDAGDNPETHRYLEIICNSSQKMGYLIDDLLTLSRLGRQAVQKERVDCEKLVREIWEEMGRHGVAGRATLELEPLPPAYADPALLRHVWVNLLGNAAKYSSKNENSLIVVSAKVENGDTLYSVRDNGVGFDQRYADKLFGVFQRLHTDKEFPGTGVGLAIVQRIVHKHGGIIQGEGEIDHGARFEFSLGGTANG